MVCGLAVTITKASTAPEHLQKLLTPAVVQTLVEAVVKAHELFADYPDSRSVRVSGDYVAVNLDLFHYLTIYRNSAGIWKVNGNFRRTVNTTVWEENQKLEAITTLLTTLLGRGADRLYAQQVRGILQKQFGSVQEKQQTVRNGETVMEVTELSFEF